MWHCVIADLLYKKGDSLECRNYRGISLLIIVSKILSTKNCMKLLSHVKIELSTSQNGFKRENVPLTKHSPLIHRFKDHL